MVDKFVKTTKTGLGSRLMSSIKGVFIGILLFLISFGVLYWNEGRVDVSEVAKNAVEADSQTVDASLDGQFVYVTDEIVSDEMIGDGLYLIPGNYLAVSRTVEMYSWVEETHTETEEKYGGSEVTETTYKYDKQWTNNPPETSSFEYPDDHMNPPKGIDDYDGRVNVASIGVYGLDMNDLSLSGYKDLSLSEEVIDYSKLKDASVESGDDVEVNTSDDDTSVEWEWEVSTEEVEGEGTTVKESTGPEVSGGFIFVGEGSLTSPEVGDLRISYSVIKSGIKGTVFAQLNGSNLETYYDEGTETSLYRMFTGTRNEALSTMHGEYKMMLWIFRIIGFLMMWFGLSSLFEPIVVFLHIVPALGQLSKSLVGFVTFIVAAILSFVTILISMILHSIIALIIAAVVILAISLYLVKGKLKKPKVVKA